PDQYTSLEYITQGFFYGVNESKLLSRRNTSPSGCESWKSLRYHDFNHGHRYATMIITRTLPDQYTSLEYITQGFLLYIPVKWST
ncbi:MAG TPA: hypothetical protein PLQ53_12045, partial [Saprospiraceae bacterium]|nr:hypothetical protein [Saprospiraceae bacterium]